MIILKILISVFIWKCFQYHRKPNRIEIMQTRSNNFIYRSKNVEEFKFF
jgi:hypothetical protein